jgi:hypothetical protein
MASSSACLEACMRARKFGSQRNVRSNYIMSNALHRKGLKGDVRSGVGSSCYVLWL